MYSPLSEIENKDVWEYLLKDDGKSAWGTDNRYLYSLYQGEEMGEEQDKFALAVIIFKLLNNVTDFLPIILIACVA